MFVLSVILSLGNSVILSTSLKLYPCLWRVHAGALIFQMSMIRPFLENHFLLPCDLDLGVWPIFENFNLANNFWTVSARALIFNMSISSDNICPCDFGHYLDHLCFTNTSCFLFTLYNTDLSVIVKLEQALLWIDTWIWKPFVDNLLNERKSIDY